MTDVAIQDAPTSDTPPAATADAHQDAPEPKEPSSQANPWLKRLGEQTAKIRETEERLAAAERRAQEAEALAQRMQAAQQPQSTQQPSQGQQTPTLTTPASDETRRAEIQREAQRQRFIEDTVEVRNRGYAQFGGAWNETLNILNSLGATSDEFVADVMAVDKAAAHEIFATLSKDPEKLTNLTSMNSRQRIAEITRLTMASKASPAPTPAPAPKITSKAPPPPPPIEPSSSKPKEPGHWRTDAASDEEFHRGFDEMAVARSRRR